jgi:hypothetical protein
MNNVLRKSYAIAAATAALCVTAMPANADKNPGGTWDFFSTLGKNRPATGTQDDPVQGKGAQFDKFGDELPMGVPVRRTPVGSDAPPSVDPPMTPVPLTPTCPRDLPFKGALNIRDDKGVIVGTWTWNPTTMNFEVAYSNGFHERLRVDEFTQTRMVASGYNNAGVAVQYVGDRKGNSASGTATGFLTGAKIIWNWSTSW